MAERDICIWAPTRSCVPYDMLSQTSTAIHTNGHCGATVKGWGAGTLEPDSRKVTTDDHTAVLEDIDAPAGPFLVAPNEGAAAANRIVVNRALTADSQLDLYIRVAKEAALINVEAGAGEIFVGRGSAIPVHDATEVGAAIRITTVDE